MIYTLLFWLMLFGSQSGNEKAPRLLWSDEFNCKGQPDTTRWTYDLSNCFIYYRKVLDLGQNS
jgi:hypothetical protein